MAAGTTSDRTMRVVLDAPGPQAALAADVLARAAGMTVAAARLRLAQTGAALAVLPAPAAGTLVPMLRVLGLTVRTEPLDAGRRCPGGRLDLALQWARPGDGAMPVRAMAVALGRAPEAVAAGLASPSGLVLAGLHRAGVEPMRDRLRAIPALRLVVSDPASAVFDLLSRPGAPPGPALVRDLARLGLARCRLTGALAAGLDRAMRDHILRRHPGEPVIAVNRDFQRFDLVLTGARGLSAAELDGFLRTRAGAAPGCGAGVGAQARRCVERALARADALAFQSDYAAIGIDTEARLVWPEAARMS